MVAIKLIGFQGEQPRLIPRLLPSAGAKTAINCRLDDGGLAPIRRAAYVADSPVADPQSICFHDGAWLAWDTVVNAAPGPVDDTRLYVTGDGAPKLIENGVEYPLAVPRPPSKLTATLGGSGAGDAVTRVYVFTWVTGFGEESEPSPPSDPIVWKPGNSVTVSGFPATPSGRNITHQRIYRSQTGQSGTYLYLIAERSAANTDFSDTVPVNAFQEPLPSADWNSPPDDLAGLVAMANGMMAAFVGRRLYFCEPYLPHAWPEKYAQTCDSDIVGLAAIGSALVVMTEGQPYFATGSSPGTVVMERLRVNWPCINARAIANLGFGVVYPTHEGLALVAGDGSANLVSGNLFGRDDWQRFSPATMVAAQLAGRYVAFYDTLDADGAVLAGSLTVEPGGTPFLVRTTLRARAAYFDVPSSRLYFVPHDADTIWQFDAEGAALEDQYWRSKEFVLPYPENFGAIQVDADATVSEADLAAAEAQNAAIEAANAALIADDALDGALNTAALGVYGLNGDALAGFNEASDLVVGVIADGTRVANVRVTNKPARLPAGFKARVWEIDVMGARTVTAITMGRTMDDIAAAP